MKDYIGNLVQRARGQAVVVRPITHPIFPPDVSPLAWAMTENVDEPIPSRRKSTTEARSRVESFKPGKAPTGKVDAPSTKTVPAIPLSLPQDPTPKSPSRLARDTLPDTRVPLGELPIVEEEPRAATASELWTTDARAEARADTFEPVPFPEEQIPYREGRNPGPDQPIARAARQRMFPPAMTTPKSVQQDELFEPESTAPPTVHVSIGRIEVRAVVVPAPKPAPPANEQTLSLEDYLKERRERRRR